MPDNIADCPACQAAQARSRPLEAMTARELAEACRQVAQPDSADPRLEPGPAYDATPDLAALDRHTTELGALLPDWPAPGVRSLVDALRRAGGR